MLVSGKEIYDLMIPYVKGKYCFIAPDQGGHGKAGAYVSADTEYQELKRYLLDNDHRQIKLLFGASLGAAIAWRLYNDDDLTIGKAWLDGPSFSNGSEAAKWFLSNMFRKKQKKLNGEGIKRSDSFVKDYGADYARIMYGNLARFTQQDISAVSNAFFDYEMQPLSKTKKEAIHLEYGEKDPVFMLAKPAIAKYLPGIKVMLRKGQTHCGYMAAQPQKYVEAIEAFINS